jgi:hypothetical protein
LCLLLGFDLRTVMTDRAANRGARNAVVPCHVSGNASDCRARYATFGLDDR